jgi:putative RNA 2'-phosphotransferase
MNYERLSKFMSLVLRHNPSAAGVQLDAEGWCYVENLVLGMGKSFPNVERSDIEYVVSTDSKQRYAISDDGGRIRANQGHSVKIDLGLKRAEPPAFLYHGTVERFLGSIRAEGLKKMKRHHVHLSTDRATAENVGGRRGEAVVLTIDAGQMHVDGFEFFLSDNGVWLVDQVPAEYIKVQT